MCVSFDVSLNRICLTSPKQPMNLLGSRIRGLS